MKRKNDFLSRWGNGVAKCKHWEINCIAEAGVVLKGQYPDNTIIRKKKLFARKFTKVLLRGQKT